MTASLKNMTARTNRAPLTGEPTVGAGFAKGVLDFAVSKGAPREAMLAKAGIASDDVADLDNRIPLSRYVALIEAGAALLNEPGLALLYGQAVRMQEISIVGLICEACERTVEVGVQMNRYWRLALDEEESDTPMMRLVRDEAGFWIE